MRLDTLTPARLASAAVIACAAALIPAASLAATAAPGTAAAAAPATTAREAGAPACATSRLVVWAYPNYGGGYPGATGTPSASPTCPGTCAPCAATPG
jgi:hypothetical protein